MTLSHIYQDYAAYSKEELTKNHIYTAENRMSSTVVRGGPFDMWGGGYGFSFLIKLFFSTPSLNVHFFSDLIKSKQFFSQQ